MNTSKAVRLCRVILLLAASLPAGAQENARPVVSVERAGLFFKVFASVVLPVPPCTAYRLLADYSSLPGYIPGMLQIRQKRLTPNRVDIWQQGEVEVLFFKFKLESSLEMEETPGLRITFRQTEGDLESYSGEWNLLDTRQGTKVSYDASITLKQDDFIPVFLAKKVLEKEVSVRFEAIAKEASARKDRAVTECVQGK